MTETRAKSLRSATLASRTDLGKRWVISAARRDKKTGRVIPHRIPILCKIDGCLSKVKARRLCPKHYLRWWRYGDPLFTVIAAHGEPWAWLLAHRTHTGEGCLTWPFGRNPDGYGAIDQETNGTLLAHRKMCELAHGPAPTPEHEAAHGCGNGHGGCCHPEHLRWATHAENMADMKLHGRSHKGERSPLAKLTEQQAIEVYQRAQSGENQTRIAKDFGVSRGCVSLIKRKKNWPHIHEGEVRV